MLALTMELGGRADLSVRTFSVEDTFSSLFEIKITAVSPLQAVDLDTITGRPARFSITDPDRGAHRLWTGICRRITHTRASEEGLCTYAVRIVPDLWLASVGCRRQTFQGISTPQIAAILLDRWRVPHRLEIDPGAYPPLEFKAQFEESDYTFLLRILAEAGISFHFDRFETDSGPRSGVVLCDAPQTRAPLVAPIPYVSKLPRVITSDHVTAVRITRKVRPGSHVLHDFDFRQPSFHFDSKATPRPGPEGRLEQARYAPGSFVARAAAGGDTPSADDRGPYRATEAEGTRRAKLSLEAEERERWRISYATTQIDLAPGAVFAIANHPRDDLSGGRELLVTRTFLAGTYQSIEGCTGEAVFADKPYRPAQDIAKPRLHGVWTATVGTLENKEEIRTDEFGRVRVQLHWDPQGLDSCWVRTSRGWAGAGYGLSSIPRAGEEVLVSFQDGDPDQPVVVGRVFNGIQRVPYDLPEHKARTVWKSRTTPSSGGGNEVFLDDRAGQELVSIQAERDLQKEVIADELEQTGGDRTIDVTGVLALEARGRLVIRAAKNVTIESGKSGHKVKINCRADKEPPAPEAPLPPARSVELSAVTKILEKTAGGLSALQSCARLRVGVRFPPGSASRFDAATNLILLGEDGTPLGQALDFIDCAVRAEWHHSARSAAPRAAYLSPEESADLTLQESAEAILQRLRARESLALQGIDVSAAPPPLRKEYEEASRESSKAGLAAIVAGLQAERTGS